MPQSSTPFRQFQQYANVFFNAVYLILVVLLACLAFLSMYRSSAWLPLWIIILLFSILILKKYLAKMTDKLKLHLDFFHHYLFWIVYVICSILLVYTAFSLRVSTKGTWDWGSIIRNVGKHVLNGSEVNTVYYARYPNNQLWLTILLHLFHLLKRIGCRSITQLIYGSIFFSCLCIMITWLLIYLISCHFWAGKAAYIGIASMLFTPFYLYSMFAYTDTSGVLICAVLIFIYVLCRNSQSKFSFALLYFLLGITGSVSYKLKVTIFIICIAIGIDLMISCRRVRTILIAFAFIICGFLAGNKCLSYAIQQSITITAEEYDRYQFPLTHWMMMSLAYGGYVQEDVNYTASFPTYEERAAADMQELHSRISARGYSGTLFYLFFTKQSRTWGDPFFASLDYSSRSPIYTNNLLRRLLKHPQFSFLLTLWTSLMYTLILIGLLLSGYQGCKAVNHTQSLLFLRISLTGFILFQMLWECNARYVFVFFPVLLILMGDGFFNTGRET